MALSNTNPYHKGIDWLLVILYVALVAFGWLNLYAANYNPETRIAFSVDAEYFKQLVWIGITALCVGVIMLVDSKMFVEISYIVFGASVLLLIVVLFAGKEVNGAKSWLAFGPVQFQPVEFTKIGTALVVSRVMSRYGFTFNFRSYAHLAVVLLIPILLVLLQNDTGSALIYFVFLLPMFREGMTGHVLIIGAMCIATAIASFLLPTEWVMAVIAFLGLMAVSYVLNRHATKREGLTAVFVCIATTVAAYFGLYVMRHGEVEPEIPVAIGAMALSVYTIIRSIVRRIRTTYTILMYMWIALTVSYATGFAFENILEPHQRTRINILFGVEDDPSGAGYNVNQSMIAIGSGGFSGKGFLEGTQTKLNFVPKQTTDFIFCTVGEEWGFMGSITLIALYLTFFIRLIILAEKQHSVFSRIYGYCVACIFFFHFMVNISMTIGLMPVIGIPLPFFSYGGSSLWGFSIMLFIFLKLDTDRNELIR
ncbi:MAG: rod shape-determining protein RodA [Bacteroidales bacterium]|nr:rod shape-determining protein RodA [Bacteroidales bacterium]